MSQSQQSLHPGPINPSVLFLHNEHIARDLFNKPSTGGEPVIHFRRGDGKFWGYLKDKKIVISQKVRDCLKLAGFLGVLDCGSRPVDRGIVEALIERWRPETHTFHLPFGEVTVTLQDVNILMGLPVEGLVVSGSELQLDTLAAAQKFLTPLFGFCPQDRDIFKGNIKIESINKFMINNPLGENATDEENEQRARCIIAVLCGGGLFADHNSQMCHFYVLQNLVNLQMCGQLSWGSAVLACLYRSLCHAVKSKPGNKSMGGSVYLLQIWAYTRLRTLAPAIKSSTYDIAPFGRRWREQLKESTTASHSITAARSALNAMSENEFVWVPYDRVLAKLPDYCTDGRLSWTCRCYLIFYNIVEYHAVDRVMRQFGCVQRIPQNMPYGPEEHRELHKWVRSGRTGTDWLSIHSVYVSTWLNREAYRVPAERIISANNAVDEGYMRWYYDISVLYISNPRQVPQTVPSGYPNHGGMNNILVDGMNQIYQQNQNFLSSRNNEGYEQLAQQNIQLSMNVMRMLNRIVDLNFPRHFGVDFDPTPDSAVPQRYTTQQQFTVSQNFNEAGSSHQNQGFSNVGTSVSPFDNMVDDLTSHPDFMDYYENLASNLQTPVSGNQANIGSYPTWQELQATHGSPPQIAQNNDFDNTRFQIHTAVPFNFSPSSSFYTTQNAPQDSQHAFEVEENIDYADPENELPLARRRIQRQRNAPRCGTGSHLIGGRVRRGRN